MEEERVMVADGGVMASLAYHRYREADGYVARSDALRLSSQGETEGEAVEALEEAVKVFLLDLVEAGVLEEVLTRDLGWRRLPPAAGYREAYEPPISVSGTLHVGPLAVAA